VYRTTGIAKLNRGGPPPTSSMLGINQPPNVPPKYSTGTLRPIPPNRAPVIYEPPKKLSLKNKFKKGIGSLRDFTKKAAMPTLKTLGRGLGLGTLAYYLAPVPSWRLGESNPVRSLDIDPSAGSWTRDFWGNNLIGSSGIGFSYDSIRKLDEEINQIKQLGDNMTTSDITRLKNLEENRQRGLNLLEGRVSDLVGGDRSVLDNTIDTAIAQLTSGSGARMSGAKLGEINTAKGVAEILENNRDQLLELMQSDEAVAKQLAPQFSQAEGLKGIAKMLDPDAYEKLFPEEVAETIGTDAKKNWEEAKKGMFGAIDEEKRKRTIEALEKQRKLDEANVELARGQAIRGKPISPEIVDKALTAGMYGGSPEDTAFAFLEDAEVTRVLEEEKKRKEDLEYLKIKGTGYADAKESELGQTGIKANFFQPNTPGGRERITDTGWHNAKNQIVEKLDNYALASQRLSELEAILANGNPSSLKAYLTRIGAKMGAALGVDFDKQTAADQYQSLQKIVQAEFTARFLNESGRTISDRDRQLVKEIFADVGGLYTIGTPLETLKHKLNEVRTIVMKGAKDYENAFTRINLANPQMALKFNNKELSDDEKIELEEYEKNSNLTEEDIQSFQESLDMYN
jgi:hypothetical protein